MPLQRRIPKRGFRRLLKNAARRDQFAEVNIGRLAGFTDGEKVDPALMADRGLIAAGSKVKVLGDGELKSKITVCAHAFSESAKWKIAASGGKFELIGA